MLRCLILFVTLIQLAFAPVAQAVPVEHDVQSTIGSDFGDQSMSVYLELDGSTQDDADLAVIVALPGAMTTSYKTIAAATKSDPDLLRKI